MRPEHRLLLCTVSSAMVVNQINKRSEILNEFGNATIDNKIKEKFDDF